ncbi:endonuclease/exonuclease/phosphatase family protein [Sorangium sp. So ce176]|uniref:endonuclease/exonuclease/phosphatase family protein n=1 Tax=Sorangium sp. So ce176 TaxID=3133286 RepID=UPI003F5DA818
MKILVWNIQFFTKRRIDDDSGSTVKQRAANAERTLANLLYITSTVEQAQPDVVVVIEPQATQGTLRTLATGGGPDGLLYLLAQLREWMDGAEWDWCLVPPQRMNPRDDLKSRTYTECVGVFWRNATMAFTGPWHWTVNGSRETTMGVAVNYPAPWDAAVPAGTTWAGQPEFQRPGAYAPITFPDVYSRRPFLTQFQERAAPNRTLRLYSVHTTPATARDACAHMRDITGARPQANQITVLAGDFNLDQNKLNTAGSSTLQAFNDLMLTLYKPPVLRQTFLTTTYRATRVKPRTKASWADYATKQVLDYALVGYGTGARPPGFQPSVEVVDRVAGTPSPPFTSDMGVRLATYPTLPGADATHLDPLEIFRQRWNYGHIAQPQRTRRQDDAPTDGTSDHLPILVTV